MQETHPRVWVEGTHETGLALYADPEASDEEVFEALHDAGYDYMNASDLDWSEDGTDEAPLLSANLPPIDQWVATVKREGYDR